MNNNWSLDLFFFIMFLISIYLRIWKEVFPKSYFSIVSWVRGFLGNLLKVLIYGTYYFFAFFPGFKVFFLKPGSWFFRDWGTLFLNVFFGLFFSLFLIIPLNFAVFFPFFFGGLTGIFLTPVNYFTKGRFIPVNSWEILVVHLSGFWSPEFFLLFLIFIYLFLIIYRYRKKGNYFNILK